MGYRASDGVIVYTNPKFEQMFGYGPGELVGKNVSVVNAPSERTPEDTAKKIIKALNEKGSWRGEILNVRKDGTLFWCYASVSIFEHPEHGSVWISMHTDITERKKASEALRQSEERLRLILQHSSDGINISKRDLKSSKRRLVLCNDKYVEMSGRSREELMAAEDLNAFVRYPEPEEIQQQWSKLIKEGKPYSGQASWIRPDGRETYYEWTAAPVRFGDMIYIIGVDRDITKRKRTEEELLFKTTLLEAQSETSIDGILVVDGEGKSLLFNKRFGQMWNIPQHILNTRDDKKMLQCALSQLKDPDKFLERVKYLYAHKDEESRDEIQLKDGKVFDRYSSPLRDSTNNHYGRIWYFRDVTDRKRAEERLAEVNECFLNFGADPVENIKSLTALCGKQLGGRCALYNRLENGQLCSIGQWNTPADYKPIDKSDGHICSDLISKATDEILLVRHLSETTYARTDPNVAAYDLKTYIGNATKCCGEYVGSICVVYQKDFVPGEDDKRILGIVASAIGVEEERRLAEKALKESRDELEIRVRERTTELENAIKILRSEISERKKAEEKLLTYQKQLRSSASELSLAEERLRRKFATDVHDHISQNLAISKLKIESLTQSAASPELTGELEEIRDLIAQVVESTRSLAR
jgi:PAS domain S-box-containing protein